MWFRLIDDRYIILSKQNTLLVMSLRWFYSHHSAYDITAWIDLFDLFSDICLLTEIYIVFFPVGIWLVCKNNMPTTYFTDWFFQLLSWWTVCSLFFLFVLQTIWEEGNVCISSPDMGTFSRVQPSWPMLCILSNPDRYGHCWLLWIQQSFTWAVNPKIILPVSVLQLLFNCSLSMAGGEKAGGWLHWH